MGTNLHHLEWRLDERGDRVPVVIPFDCACGVPACYGRDERWFCGSCWHGRGRPLVAPQTGGLALEGCEVVTAPAEQPAMKA